MEVLAGILLFAACIVSTSGTDLIQGITTRTYTPKRLTDPAPLITTDHVVSLRRTNSSSSSAAYLRALRRGVTIDRSATASTQLQTGNVSLVSVEDGYLFLGNITAGGQTFEVVIDTGSSDTWFVLSNFTCLNLTTNQETSQADCYFGAYYQPSSTLKSKPDYNFNITYDDGEYLTGLMAYEDLVLAGISVSQQEIALVTEAAWEGDGDSSGLLGLAYPTLTNAYTGSDPADDDAAKNVIYNPVFTDMYEEDSTSAMFSLALERPSDFAVSNYNKGGYLAIGGLPDIKYDPVFYNTSIDVVAVDSATGDPIYEYYSITLSGWAVSAKPWVMFTPTATSDAHTVAVIENGTVAVVDSGTSYLYAPESVVEAIAAAFSPASTYDSYFGYYTVSCDATPPLFGISISGKIFYINPVDMVVYYGDGVCIMSVQSAGDGLTILGEVFLRNVLAVFDVGAGEMRFAAREFA